jgi:hypothetical protein
VPVAFPVTRRAGRPRKQPNAETKERRRQAGGDVVDMATEVAGVTARRVVPAWERLAARGIINECHALAAVRYVRSWERLEASGYPPSVLVKAGARVDVSSVPRDVPDRVLIDASRYRRMAEVLGAELFLVDAVVRLDLIPGRTWQQAKLREALGRLADSLGC